jgi:hypothetical protein
MSCHTPTPTKRRLTTTDVATLGATPLPAECGPYHYYAKKGPLPPFFAHHQDVGLQSRKRWGKCDADVTLTYCLRVLKDSSRTPPSASGVFPTVAASAFDADLRQRIEGAVMAVLPQAEPNTPALPEQDKNAPRFLSGVTRYAVLLNVKNTSFHEFTEYNGGDRMSRWGRMGSAGKCVMTKAEHVSSPFDARLRHKSETHTLVFDNPCYPAPFNWPIPWEHYDCLDESGIRGGKGLVLPVAGKTPEGDALYESIFGHLPF